MAKTAKNIIDGIYLELQSYRENFYDKLPDSMYWIDKLNTWRSLSIRDYDVAKKHPVACFQTITEMQIEKVYRESQIDGIVVKANENIYSVDIPELIDFSWKEIMYFGTNINFSRRSVTNFNNNEGNRYTSHLPCYVVMENCKIYIKNLPTLSTQILRMTAIFAHPHLVPGYSYENTNYPVSEAMLPKIEYLLKKDVLHAFGIRQEQELTEPPKQEDEEQK